jgi:signal transduction histidine kinase
MIIDLHGGDISVKSQEDRGSRFTVRLPIFPPTPVILTGSENA